MLQVKKNRFMSPFHKIKNSFILMFKFIRILIEIDHIHSDIIEIHHGERSLCRLLLLLTASWHLKGFAYSLDFPKNASLSKSIWTECILSTANLKQNGAQKTI